MIQSAEVRGPREARDCVSIAPKALPLSLKNFGVNRSLVSASKACLYRLNYHVAYRFTRQFAARPDTLGDDLMVQAAFIKPHVPTGSLSQAISKVIQPLALIRFFDRYLASRSAATVSAFGRLGYSKPSAFLTKYAHVNYRPYSHQAAHAGRVVPSHSHSSITTR